MSACEDVIGTPELAEAILLQMTARDLLQAQRISRYIKILIQSSPRLQQALFFRAAPASKKWFVNPLLRESFLPWIVIPHPEVRSLPSHEDLERLDWTFTPERKDAFLRPEASWRRMFLIQPPPTELSIFYHKNYGQVYKTQISFKDSDSKGVTMDAIYDIPEQFTRKHHFQRRFMMRFLDPVSPLTTPIMILHMFYPGSRTSTRIPSKVDLSSRALRNWAYDDDYYDENLVRVVLPRSDWMAKTNLTTEKGGVPMSDFGEWSRKRAPISSLWSDVR
ncbi:hypothetical protein BCR34DRAFT_600852 [Clohesyomyces aquaticus]|uniref:F-box domain-containing protein n=1 Tax=Clohesyomyces aquaticus TaxID=1231657 RepID=A0A1Y1ZQ26_9PLEO|nr:hypothetical protein BCR34DRAFT_600852 [Clohesyomyces aquaticus]